MGEKGLDPENWAAFREEARRMLEASLDQLEQAGERPWQPVPADVRDGYRIRGAGDVVKAYITDDVSTYFWWEWFSRH